MNKQRALILADVLDGHVPEDLKHKVAGVGFDMTDYGNGPHGGYLIIGRQLACGCAACAGGLACLLWGREGELVGPQEAKRVLGLTNQQASQLFLNSKGYIADKRLVELTASEVADAIRRMVAGEIEAEAHETWWLERVDEGLQQDRKTAAVPEA